MSIFQRIFSKKTKYSSRDSEIKDLEPGKVSHDPEENWDGMINSIFGATKAKEFIPFELLSHIIRLSIVNPDLSTAVKNIVQLGNTGHTIEIFGQESMANAFSDELKIAAANLYSEGAGIDGFINTLFGQVARTGALSTEWVISEQLDNILDVVCVPVKDIRFVKKNGVYIPVQNVSITKDGKQYVELNPISYSYYASERIEDSPYAIPPFISSLKNISIQNDIMKELKFVARKSGLMGFLEVLVSAPVKNKNESDIQYKERCRQHIQNVSEKVKGSYNDGFIVAFKDLYEIKNTQVAGNAAGVYQLNQMNEEQVCSGIGQDPAMLGRTYSTTETYAGVVFQKMLSQITNYQRLIKRAIEKGYKLKAALSGFNIDGLSLKFNESDLVKKKDKAEAQAVEIANANALYEAGIIDQEQRAQKLGYSAPALPGSRAEMMPQQLDKAKQGQSKQSRKYPSIILQINHNGEYEVAERYRKVY